MSIAVAVSKNDTTVIGADTQTNFGDMKVPIDNVRPIKFRRVGRSYLAVTGWDLYDNILSDYLDGAQPALTTQGDVFRFFMKLWQELHKRYPFVNDQPHTDDRSPFGELDATFLVVGGEGIFHVSGNMSVIPFTRYAAIGSGADFALGALHVLYDRDDLDAATLVRRACETAMAFNVYCGGDIDVQTV
ncbi:MAG: hypothetical protein GWN84_06595 [Gammaproteobacteria bacterium]|nr:hypothetical protein [Gammaproteobacteria bacterium]NIR82579.1 hypothetical protein [Gammaproteobacteria bacterium]NIR88782.1 hypothetical protein [Gammaproteobacteria bacterium]NIV73987.1 hypothetical protein [Gammaproteobacteria bacterium]